MLNGKWDFYGDGLLEENAAELYEDFGGVRLYVHLAWIEAPGALEELRDKVQRARDLGLEVMLLLDYHVNEPVYHGAATNHPHTLGYAPFGWVRGWIWARESIARFLVELEPDAVQWARDPEVRVSPFEFVARDKQGRIRPEYHYADSLSILKQGAQEGDWRGLVVIPLTDDYPAMHRKGLQVAPRDQTDKDTGRVVARGFSLVKSEGSLDWADATEGVIVDPPDDDPPPPPPEDRTRSAVLAAEAILDLQEAIVDPLQTIDLGAAKRARRHVKRAIKRARKELGLD